MSGGLKQQWGVGDPAQVGPDPQSQDLKAAFERPMDSIAAHLAYTAANADPASHDPLATRSDALVPRYQAALSEIDPADANKAKDSIDSLIADTEALGKEVEAFRNETEKAVANWQSRSGEYDAAVVKVEELQAWPHPKEAAVRSLADAIRGFVNDRALAKAIALLDQFLPKLEPVYEDLQKQKDAKQEYEPAWAALQPRLAHAAQPSFKKLAPQQSEIASRQSAVEASANDRDFVAALAGVAPLGGLIDAYTAAVEELTRLKNEYEQALAQVQPKLQAAPNPSPFNKLAAQQAELASGQQQMESSAQSEDFEQALSQANDLGTKVDAYSAAVEELTRLKNEYEQALAQVQPKLQAAPNPSPFNKLAAQQAELASGQQQMESSAQSEEFEQALSQANDLGTKVDAYSAAVEELTRLKTEYEQALKQLDPKLRAAPNPSPSPQLVPMLAELVAGEQQMKSAADSEDFQQAANTAGELDKKVDAYVAEVCKLGNAEDDPGKGATQKSGGEAGVPAISSLSYQGKGCPLTGGIEITLQGSGFNTATSVKFGDLDAKFTIKNDNRIVAIAPDASKLFPVGGKLMPFVTTPAGRSQDEDQYLPVLFGELPPATSPEGSNTSAPGERKLEKLDRDGGDPSGTPQSTPPGNLLGSPAPAATWTPPFDLDAANNTGDATTQLVDMQRKLDEWKEVGYANEMSAARGAIDRQLKAFSGVSRPLTAADVTALDAIGVIALQATRGAMDNLRAMISAELDKYTGASAQAALDNANELLHQEFMKGDGSNKVADLKEAIGKAKDFAGKIKDYVDYAKKTQSIIKQAEKLEVVSAQLKSFTGKLATAQQALDLASDIATLAGKVSQKPGDTANAINSLRAGLRIGDFIMSKTSVPVIGQWWSGYIKPCAELALDKLQKLDDMIDKSTRSNLADEWWQRASKGMGAPNITESGLQGTLMAKVFPGGQPVLDFMWSLFIGKPPDSVPEAVQKHMLKFRKQFNAGQPEADQLQTDSAWTNAWNLFGDEKSPNLKAWMLKNKETIWAMQYGALPHP